MDFREMESGGWNWLRNIVLRVMNLWIRRAPQNTVAPSLTVGTVTFRSVRYSSLSLNTNHFPSQSRRGTGTNICTETQMRSIFLDLWTIRVPVVGIWPYRPQVFVVHMFATSVQRVVLCRTRVATL